MKHRRKITPEKVIETVKKYFNDEGSKHQSRMSMDREHIFLIDRHLHFTTPFRKIVVVITLLPSKVNYKPFPAGTDQSDQQMKPRHTRLIGSMIYY